MRNLMSRHQSVCECSYPLGAPRQVAGFDGNAQPGGGGGGGGGSTDHLTASPSSVQRSGGSTLSPLDSMPRGEVSPLADSRRALYRCGAYALE